ncbi:MAG: hypothetical protein LBU80_01570 [Rikenellaceae bacterium]|jgi:hypothetical protein|nr:hypothetical protein [Rikenellaceae bacterium]
MGQLYDNFLAVLEERYPHKPDLVSALMNVLHLERESAYRRLRKDVYFSSEEMIQIAGAWNISLDNIAYANQSKIRPFRFKMVEYLDPQEEDYVILEQHNRDLEIVARDPDGMAIEVVNALPRGLYVRSEPLTRFFTMKWRYKNSPEEAIPFYEAHIPERMRKLDLEYVQCLHKIPEMHSIHDSRMIENLVGEIVYFRSIGMLTDDETTLLRDELLMLADYLENVTLTGAFPVTGNRMFFYLSHTCVEAEYLLYRSKDFNLGLVKILERQYIGSLDGEVLDKFMKMSQATRYMSVLMSGSNALQQAEFFTRQREIIMTL